MTNYTSYKGIGGAELVSAIYRGFEFDDAPSNGQGLIEVRQNENTVSITAHGARISKELVASDDGKLTLKRTMPDVKLQTVTTVAADGTTTHTKQDYNPEKGLTTGDPREVLLSDAKLKRMAVEAVAAKVLPLVRPLMKSDKPKDKPKLDDLAADDGPKPVNVSGLVGKLGPLKKPAPG
jgi:hypothetical protein